MRGSHVWPLDWRGLLPGLEHKTSVKRSVLVIFSRPVLSRIPRPSHGCPSRRFAFRWACWLSPRRVDRAPNGKRQGGSSPIMRIIIDKRPLFSYITPTPLTYQDAIRRTTGWRSGCGSRGHGLVTCAPGRLRQDTPGRHHDRTAGAISLDGDRKARVTPAVTRWAGVFRPCVAKCASFEPSGRALRPSPRKSRG